MMMTTKNKLIAVLLGSNLADFYLTTFILTLDGGEEANPVMKFLFELHPYAPLAYKLFALLMCVIVFSIYKRRRRIIGILVALNVLFSAVVLYSIGLILFSMGHLQWILEI